MRGAQHDINSSRHDKLPLFLAKSGAFHSHLEPLDIPNMYMGYQEMILRKSHTSVPKENSFLCRRLLLRPFIMIHK